MWFGPARNARYLLKWILAVRCSSPRQPVREVDREQYRRIINVPAHLWHRGRVQKTPAPLVLQFIVIWLYARSHRVHTVAARRNGERTQNG